MRSDRLVFFLFALVIGTDLPAQVAQSKLPVNKPVEIHDTIINRLDAGNYLSAASIAVALYQGIQDANWKRDTSDLLNRMDKTLQQILREIDGFRVWVPEALNDSRVKGYEDMVNSSRRAIKQFLENGNIDKPGEDGERAREALQQIVRQNLKIAGINPLLDYHQYGFGAIDFVTSGVSIGILASKISRLDENEFKDWVKDLINNYYLPSIASTTVSPNSFEARRQTSELVYKANEQILRDNFGDNIFDKAYEGELSRYVIGYTTRSVVEGKSDRSVTKYDTCWVRFFGNIAKGIKADPFTEENVLLYQPRYGHGSNSDNQFYQQSPCNNNAVPSWIVNAVNNDNDGRGHGVIPLYNENVKLEKELAIKINSIKGVIEDLRKLISH